MRKLTPYTPEAQEIKPIFSEITAAVKALNQVLPEAIVAAEVYTIDLYGIGEDGKPIVPDKICPYPVTGAEAIRLTQNAYGQFKRFENQHQSTSMRLPGIVFVNDLPWDLVKRVNELKTQLHGLITDHYPPGSRAVITRQLFRGASTCEMVLILVVFPAQVKTSFRGSSSTIFICTI